ncbi:unnamed protein product [Oncorhynchus mykiss]|uniref:Zinc finger protein 865 n=1 Tax=Oncorhynchus mykiss TaxID=8022 RepID=A0A060WEY5_ONCMY|nr:unnamed protein product [Oncorhynchus mykiss]
MAMHDMSRVKGFPCKECDMVCPSTPSLLEHMKAHYQQEENGRFECEQCGRIYKHAGSLANHKKSHEVGSFQCPVCTRTLPNAVALKNHLRIHTLSPSNDHKKSPVTDDAWDRPFKCDQCDRTYRHHGSLVNHKKCHQEGAFKCTVCYKQFNNLAALNGHERTHSKAQSSSDDGERRFKCQDCGKSYRHAGSLVNHKRSHQTGLYQCTICCKHHANNPTGPGTSVLSPNGEADWRIICSTCGQSFSRKQDLLNHQLIHGPQRQQMPDSEDRPHKCDQCGRGYRHPCSLLNHKKSHKTGVFRCLVCQKRYYNLLALKNHQRTHFDLKSKAAAGTGRSGPQVAPDSETMALLEWHKCEECGKAFKIQKQLENHLRLHEEHRAKAHAQLAKLGNGRPFACDECGRSYRHAGSLANHKNLHKIGEYHCNVCNSTYPNRLAMKNHLRLHFALKKHTCQECGKGFRTQKQLTTHHSAQLCKGAAGAVAQMDYEYERPYSCDICNCSYKHASSLLNHKHTHKTGTFTCTYCDKPYSNYMALRNHMRIHTQKKRHICHHCGKAFRLARFLRNHQKVHEEGHTRFGCTSCGKSFQGRSGLARHRCGENQEGRRMATASTTGGEECRYTYMISNPASLGPYVHRNSAISEVWTD